MQKALCSAAARQKSNHTISSPTYNGDVGGASSLEVGCLMAKVRSLEEDVEIKARRIDELERHVKLLQAAAAAAGDKVVIPPGGIEAPTTEALLEALHEGCSYIYLSGTEYETDVDDVVQLRERKVHLVGDCRAGRPKPTFRVNLSLERGTQFTAEGVSFVSHKRSIAAISASTKCKIALTNCDVSSGRCGVFLSGGAQASLKDCTISGNIRGVFESVGCQATIEGCVFRANMFDTVLLAVTKNGPQRAELVTSRNKFDDADGADHRGDIVLRYNPITDEYYDVYKEGGLIVLTDEQRTAKLVDPSW